MITPDPWIYREVPGGHYVACETGVRPPNDVVICELKNTRGHDAESNGKIIEAAGNAANEIENPEEVFERLPDFMEALNTDVDASMAELVREAAFHFPGEKGWKILEEFAEEIERLANAED